MNDSASQSPLPKIENLAVDLDVIAQRLYSAPNVLPRIVRDYGFDTTPASPRALAEALWAEFGQTPIEDPHLQQPSNRTVFRAAVRSIGSNSRSWATYLRTEPDLEELLFQFDPVEVNAAVEDGRISVSSIGRFLPGQSSSGDARAIIKWAKRLTGEGLFHEELRAIAACFESMAKRELPGGFAQGEHFLCVVGFLGYPPNRWLKKADLPEHLRGRSAEEWKLPGMGYALTSEMLRNLRWDGYKADRHIMRLLDSWVPELVEASQERALQLAALIGTKNRDLLNVLAFSLAGMSLAPDGIPRSHVDNMIWALGAYVEKKGHESDIAFVV